MFTDLYTAEAHVQDRRREIMSGWDRPRWSLRLPRRWHSPEPRPTSAPALPSVLSS